MFRYIFIYDMLHQRLVLRLIRVSMRRFRLIFGLMLA